MAAQSMEKLFLDPADVGTVAIVGAGTIGASWGAWFLAQNYTVRVYDVGADFFDIVRSRVAGVWPTLSRLGVATTPIEEALERLTDVRGIDEAVSSADFVQESAPERLELKQNLLRSIDAALPADRIIASSTSGFGVTALQAEMRHPQRLVIGHPFNPPHLIPLVEVVGGGRTSDGAVRWAMDFYERIGKKPIHVRKEITGHLANRLQAALWREAVHLVAEDVASVADIDAAIAYGPGLRWAIMGPHLVAALAGGTGGMAHYLDHLGIVVEEWWNTLGAPRLTDETRAKLIDGVAAEIQGGSIDSLTKERDELLLGILKLLEKHRR